MAGPGGHARAARFGAHRAVGDRRAHGQRFGMDDQRLQGEFSLALGSSAHARRRGRGRAPRTRSWPRMAGRRSCTCRWGAAGGWRRVASCGATCRGGPGGVVHAGAVLGELSRLVQRGAGAPGHRARRHDPRARLTRFLGTRGSLTVMGASGREVEALSAAGPLVAAVRAAGAWGVIPVAPHLALTWGADVATRYEGLFTRATRRWGRGCRRR